MSIDYGTLTITEQETVNETDQLVDTVNTLNQVASLKQAQHNISQIDQATMAQGNNGDLGSVVGALASALAKPRDDTSSMAMMMQMNQQAQQSAQAARDSQDQRFTALLNIMFQQQAQSQTMMMEAMRGGGTRSALEERILNKSVDQMLTGNATPEDTLLTQLVQSGQLPEIGKGLLDGVAGAVAANSIIRTSVGISGLTALLTWFVWAIFIFVIGVKIFPDKGSKVPFKKVLIAVGYAHAPGLIRFFAVTPDLVLPIIFLTQFWIFASLIISTKQILNLKSNLKSFGIVFLSFLIIAFLSITFIINRMNSIPISSIS